MAVVRSRWLWLTVWLVGWSAVHVRARGFGWHFFVTGARLLVGQHDLHLYAEHPELQSGPLAFVAVAPLVQLLPVRLSEAAGIALMSVAGLVVLYQLEGLVAPSARTRRTVTVLGLLVLPVWAELAVHWAHPDDVLALLATVGALRLVRSGRWEWAAVALAAGVDCKPWAAVFVPLLLLGPRRRWLSAGAVWAVVVAVVWAPFYLADRASLTRVSAFQIPVSSASVIHLLGVHSTGTPGWCRSAQLVLGLVLVGVAVARRRWAAVLLVGICARMVLDPATKSYYDAGLVLGAAVWDLAAPELVGWDVAGGAVPVMTVAAVALVYLPSLVVSTHPTVRAVLSLVFLAAAPIVVLAGRREPTARARPVFQQVTGPDPT